MADPRSWAENSYSTGPFTTRPTNPFSHGPLRVSSPADSTQREFHQSSLRLAVGIVGMQFDITDVTSRRSEAVTVMPYAHQLSTHGNINSRRVGNGSGRILLTGSNAAGSEEIARFFPGVPLVEGSSGRFGNGNGNGTVLHPSPTRTNTAGSEEMAERLFNAIPGPSYRNVTITVDYSDGIQSANSLAGIEYGSGGINLRRTETVDGHGRLLYVSGMATGPTFSNFSPRTQNYGSVRADHEIPINIGSNDWETSVELDNILSGISRSTQGILVQAATGTINRTLNHSSYSPFVDAAVLAGIGFTVAGIATRRNNRDLSRVFAKTGAVLAASAIIASICIPLPPPVAYIVGPLAFILAATAVVLAT